MNRTEQTARPTADERHDHHCAEISAKLEAIREAMLLEVVAFDNAGRTHWGHVGDVWTVNDLLSQALATLTEAG